MIGNPYMNNYNPQINLDRIDTQIRELEKLKEQMQRPVQQPSINQTFQLAPTGTNTMRYANTIDDVNKEVIYGDTPFFSKDMSVLWVKNVKGNIKTYELNEIIPKDDKDLMIESLKMQIEDLRKEMKNNEQFNTNDISTEDTTNTTNVDAEYGTTVEDAEPTSVQGLSTSKKGK